MLHPARLPIRKPTMDPSPRRSPRIAASQGKTLSGNAGAAGEGRRLSYGPSPGSGSGATSQSNTRKRPAMDPSPDSQDERLGMRSVRHTDPDIDVFGGSDEADDLLTDEESGDGTAGLLGDPVFCSVPDCKLNTTIDPRTSQHRCKHCGQHFHAMCAYASTQSDDPSDCGCEQRLEKAHAPKTAAKPPAGAAELETAPVQSPPELQPPATLTDGERVAWRDGADLSKNHRVLPARFRGDTLLELAWQKARAARKRYRDKIRKAAGRAANAKGKGAQHESHSLDPDYAASSGDTRAASRTADEIARLFHVLAEEQLRESATVIMEGRTTRAEHDDKVSRPVLQDSHA